MKSLCVKLGINSVESERKMLLDFISFKFKKIPYLKFQLFQLNESKQSLSMKLEQKMKKKWDIYE